MTLEQKLKNVSSHVKMVTYRGVFIDSDGKIKHSISIELDKWIIQSHLDNGNENPDYIKEETDAIFKVCVDSAQKNENGMVINIFCK